MKTEILRIKEACKSGPDYLYDLLLLQDDDGLMTVKVDTTPGQWYLGTLLEDDSKAERETLSIYGNDWIWTNYSEAMAELFKEMNAKNIDWTQNIRDYKKRFTQ